jgi:hypothetical protein
MAASSPGKAFRKLESAKLSACWVLPAKKQPRRAWSRGGLCGL